MSAIDRTIEKYLKNGNAKFGELTMKEMSDEQ